MNIAPVAHVMIYALFNNRQYPCWVEDDGWLGCISTSKVSDAVPIVIKPLAECWNAEAEEITARVKEKYRKVDLEI